MFSIDREEITSAYSGLLWQDVVPAKGGALEKILRQNPKLLAAAISDPDDLSSIVSIAYEEGSLCFADFVLMQNGRFLPGADPFYCGEEEGRVTTLLHSAGLNVYLALMTLRFYLQKSELSSEYQLVHLITVDGFGDLHVRKTYNDCLYWDNQGAKCSAALNENRAYAERIAPWFMKKVYEVFQIECALTQARSLPERQDLHARLGEFYQCIAYMEDRNYRVFSYYLNKALEHYRQTSPSYQTENVRAFEECMPFQEQIFDLQAEKWTERFSVEEGINDHVKTLDEWMACYDFASSQRYAIQSGRIECCNVQERVSDSTKSTSASDDSGEHALPSTLSTTKNHLIYRGNNQSLKFGSAAQTPSAPLSTITQHTLPKGKVKFS